MRRLAVLALILCSCGVAMADTGGSISGTVKDTMGGAVPDTAVIARNVDTAVEQTVNTSTEGFYAFTVLPVGHYEVSTFRPGFKPYKRTGLVIDVNTKLQIDITLEIGEQAEQVTVTDTGVHVETESTQVGEVVTGSVMTAVALNGRSFTDLMALQPGIVPVSTQTPDSVVMAGATVAIAPSGGLNAGNQSISGQREDANGFLVNDGDVKELMNGGTLIVPDLDSISEFRILTNNFDAEYGNYSGGIVNVVTKSGTNQIHGTAFDFLRNTALDARNFFDTKVEAYRQNQFGGAIGGPIFKNRVFFFADYQGTRTSQGLPTGNIAVASNADRSGNLSDLENVLATGCGGGPCTVSPCDAGFASSCLATQLSNSLTSAVGQPVTVTGGEPYFTPGCTSYTQCVFPNGQFPVGAWSSPAQHLLQFIPTPSTGASTFSGSGIETVRDDKTSGRVDWNTNRWGQFSAYYFYDNYFVNNPFPRGQGGASVPGFGALNIGTAQLINLGNTKTFGSSMVNEAHISLMRTYNNVGKPSAGVGASLASQGFVECTVANASTCHGILPLDPTIEGIENINFSSLGFVMGLPITNLDQTNNTYTFSDSLSRVVGTHTIKVGAQAILNQVNVHPNPEFNGGFTFNGAETGSDFVDFLVGAPNLYNQADSQAYYPRHKYVGAFAQDSWRLRPNLTLNYGLRWELMRYWSEKFDQIPTFAPGQQSEVYPTAPLGLVHPTDKGIPNTFAPQRNRFAPRIGIAYSPNVSNEILKKIVGGPGATSIRAGYGMFYTVIQGNLLAFDEPQPPYGLSFTNGAPSLFATPFIAATGEPVPNPYPIVFPPLNATSAHPNPNLDFSRFLPIQGMTAPPPAATYPYTENYFLSFQRELGANMVLNLSYVGAQAHHQTVVYSANPGNPALCLALNQPGILGAGQSCGPGDENTAFTLAAPLVFNGTTYPTGTTFETTRLGLNPDYFTSLYGNDDYEGSIGNSNYNSFQATLQRRVRTLNFSFSYTYSKSIDQASSMADVLNPFDFEQTRAPSAFDIKHNFVATYEYTLPLEKLFHHANRWTQGWTISGITHANTGLPVTLSETTDNSLQGSNPNGVNNRYFDLPDVMPGALKISGSPNQNTTIGGPTYFNTSSFQTNALGTPGNASRRYFYGPGSFNTDLALLKTISLTETKSVQFRLETFNTFNHSQFFGPATVNGNFNSPQFGYVVQANPPRLMQLALKFAF